MERFLVLIVGGGLALVAGLWLGVLSEASGWRLAGVALGVFGVAALAAGIATEIDR